MEESKYRASASRKQPIDKTTVISTIDHLGIATVPMVAAVATEEPEIAANSPQLRIVATANPPGQWPTQACTALNRSRPTPPFSNTFDINRNNGTASKMNPSNVEKSLVVPSRRKSAKE